MTILEVPDSPKMLREALCMAQSMVVRSIYTPGDNKKQQTIKTLQRLINECDRHRPLGFDGKHGNLHTDTCGCEDKGPRDTWGTVTLYDGRIHIRAYGTERTTLCGEFCPISYLALMKANATCKECIIINSLIGTNG